MSKSPTGAGKGPAWQRAKTHCDNGHEFTEANTYIRPDGARDCRECMRDRRLKWASKPRPLCSYCGQRPVQAKDLCTVCYRMVRLYGVPSTGRFDPVKIRERRTAYFWEHVDKRGPDECWPWTGKIIKSNGYGQLSWFGEVGTIGAHRAAYELEYGEIPPGDPADPIQIDHTCHDPRVCKLKTKCPHRRCCNPAHLEAVPRSVNFERSDRSRPGNGGKGASGGKPCPPGCTCKRHANRPAVECPPGCTCGRHRDTSVKCPPGCDCRRHSWRNDQRQPSANLAPGAPAGSMPPLPFGTVPESLQSKIEGSVCTT